MYFPIFSTRFECKFFPGSIREVYSKVEKVLLQISTVQFKPTVGFVVGGPGSGKGTICDLLSKEFGFVSINSGALIRSAVAQKTEVGRQVEKMVKNNELVPDDVVIGLIVKEMRAYGMRKTFVLDG